MSDITIVRVDKDIDGNIPGFHARSERCAIDATTFAALGFGSAPDFARAGNRPQIRVTAKTHQAKNTLYTIARLANDTGTLEMGPKAWARLGLPESPVRTRVEARVESTVITPDFTEELIGHPTAAASSLIVIAPHGGHIEEHTDMQARTVADELRPIGQDVTTWICEGRGGNAYIRWHITSTDISERSFKQLNELLARKRRYAVAFHGWDEAYIGIGGNANHDLKAKIEAAVRRAVGSTFTVKVEGGDFSGNHPHNIINRLAGASIQIEQPLSARATYGKDIAVAVAGVYIAISNVLTVGRGGATVREGPTRLSNIKENLSPGTVRGVAEVKFDGENVQGSAVWYRLDAGGWVHSSGGKIEIDDWGMLTVGRGGATVREGPTRLSNIKENLSPGTVRGVAEVKFDGENVQGSAVWYRLDAGGWVHSSGGTVTLPG